MSDTAGTPRSSTAPAVDPLPAQPPNPSASTATSTATASPNPPTSPRSVARLSPPASLDTTTKLARNVSPGLLARMKFLNQGNAANNKSAADVGRIEEDKIRRLDDFHKDRSFKIERRGTAWSGVGPDPWADRRGSASQGSASQTGTPLIPQLTGESIPTLVMEPDESDRSSVVTTSDKVLPSESDAGPDDVLDMQKYRLPDLTKTKSLHPPDSQPVPVHASAPAPAPAPPPQRPQTPPEPEAVSATATETAPTRPPTPPPKDTPPLLPPPPLDDVSVLDDHNDIDIAAYFQRRHYPRATSIYTLSKASFTNQIQGLTSMKLPPTTIASEITALPTSTQAGRALHKAANDIRLWMAKANEVLSGLDAEDDVEWAAAAGREGLAEVDAAIGKFEGLVTVYITAIEDLQARPDISALPTRDQTTLVTQMEEIVSSWSQIKQTLKGIKNQVEVAMEWEELWNNVLGDIGAEVESLSRLVFEMEERRHRVISDSVAEAPEKFDIAELATIVEETPRQPKMHNNRFSMPPALPLKSPISPIPQIEQENSRLLALFAKLQPLRASLDFLPMRLASFSMRAGDIFPSACDELKRRKEQLEQQEKKLEADADALREELGEDKWVHSFRQAGSKAVALYDSCMKSVQKLQQAIDENDEEKITSRIATYKDKRDYYPASMRRVLELIDIEMKHRSTVNGEILRIQQDVRAKVSDLETVTADMDKILQDYNASRKLRDSVSTVLSVRTETSVSNSALDTPNSSPASSVVVSRRSSDHPVTTPVTKKTRQPTTATRKPSIPTNRRYSSVPLTTGITPRDPTGPTYIEATPFRDGAPTPTRFVRSVTPMTERTKTERPAVKPRWNSSTNMNDTVVGHNFRPMSLTPPSAFRKQAQTPVRSASSQSHLPGRSPLGRSPLSPPPTGRTMSMTPAPTTPARSKLPMRSPSGSASQLSSSTPASGRRLIQADDDHDTAADASPIARRAARPASAMNSRRGSALAGGKQRTTSTSSLASLKAPARSGSRLSTTEGAGDGRSSRVSGRQSSQGERTPWR